MGVPLKKEKGLETLVLSYLEEPREYLLEEIIKKTTGLVYHYAKRYGRPALLQDLTQAGFEGVLKALKNFDPNKGVLFVTYASYYIRGEMYKELQRETSYKLPPGLRKIKEQIFSAMDELRQSLQREPSLKEISKKINIAEEGVIEALLAGVISFEELDISQIRSLRYESFKLPIEDQLLLKESFSKLSDLQQRVVYLNFYKGFTQQRIAVELGTNQRQVSRLLNKSLKQLALYMTG